MKILIIGGGGREHALAWRLSQSAGCTALFASPGNPGIAQCATCLPAPVDLLGFAAMAEANQIDLTIVGPEAPLVAGIVDVFRQRGLKIIGPTQAAANLEGSKIFAKQLFQKAGIPTARSVETGNVQDALASLSRFDLPVVIKADGLHAGKGVVIAQTFEEAKQAIHRLGPALVMEEFLAGEEVSFIGLSDGKSFRPFAPAQDHKRVFDNDLGANTGGMGAYVDQGILTSAERSSILDTIIYPTLHAMAKQANPFTGFLYAGLMMTADGPKLLEYNVRLGDPETQAILHNSTGDLLPLLLGEDEEKGAAEICSVAITLAAQNYPDTPRVGDTINGIAEAERCGVTVFQAGTKSADGQLMTNGGRVLSVTASAPTLPAAIDSAYQAASRIHFDGMQYRRDIGRKGLARW